MSTLFVQMVLAGLQQELGCVGLPARYSRVTFGSEERDEIGEKRTFGPRRAVLQSGGFSSHKLRRIQTSNPHPLPILWVQGGCCPPSQLRQACGFFPRASRKRGSNPAQSHRSFGIRYTLQKFLPSLSETSSRASSRLLRTLKKNKN